MTLETLTYISWCSYFAQCRCDIVCHEIFVNHVSLHVLGCLLKEVTDSVEGSTETSAIEAGNSADDNERRGQTSKRKARNKELPAPDVKRRKASNIATDINIEKKTVKCDKTFIETSDIMVDKSNKNIEKNTKTKVVPVTNSPVEGRSSRITRNVRTPNWKNVLSGKVSIRDACNEKKPNTSEKTVTVIIPNTPEKVQDKHPRQNVRNKVILENKFKDHTENRTKSKSDKLLYKNDKREMSEGTKDKEDLVTSKKEQKDQNVASQVKQCSVNLIAVDSKEIKKDDMSVTGSDRAVLTKAGFNDKCLKASIGNVLCQVNARKKQNNKKLRDIDGKNNVIIKHSEDEKRLFCEQKQSQENTNTESLEHSKEMPRPDKNCKKSLLVNSQNISKSKSIKELELTEKRTKGRPKGSKNKTQEDEDNEFEAAVEVFNYTGHSGRPKRTSIRVKIEPEEINTKTEFINTEAEMHQKRKSKKSVALDSVSLDEIHLSDDEDILEWKGVGETKGRGRPKGSFLKKYEILTQPLDLEAKVHDTTKKGLMPLPEEDIGKGLRSSSRIKSYLCEICAESFSLRYLLDEHYQKIHPNDNVKSEPETEHVGKRGRKRKNTDKDDNEQAKETKANSSGDTNEDDEYANGMIGIDDKDLDSGDDYQDKDDKAWEISDEEADDVNDYDDEDDHLAEKTKTKLDKKPAIKVENKTGDYSCPECFQKFKSLISLQVHKIVHMKKELTFECVTCKQKFLTQKDLQIHSQKAHTTDYGTLVYFGFVVCDGKIRCEICLKDFETMDSYHDHRPVHLSLKHNCCNCGKCFVTNDELETHCQSKMCRG